MIEATTNTYTAEEASLRPPRPPKFCPKLPDFVKHLKVSDDFVVEMVLAAVA